MNSGTGEAIIEAERHEIIHNITVQPAWIAEGVYVGWAQELWREANLVIYLRRNLRAILWRVFLRHLKAELKRNNRHPAGSNCFA
jgi:hypothetical protein